MRQLAVTAAIIRNGKKILIAKRTKETLIEPGKWELPGGKIEFGEKPKDCLAREIKEELDLKITIRKLYDATSHVFTVKKEKIFVVLLVYEARIISGKIKNIGCEETRWVLPKELLKYDFVDGDFEIIRKLSKS